MKQKIAKLCLAAFAVTLLIGIYQGRELWQPAPAEAAQEELRGFWIASVYNINYPSKPGLGTVQLKKELDMILDQAEKMHMNAIFFQVRPVADALYDSKLYPWSAYLTGTQGQAPADGFDPLDYLVKQAETRGIGIHAWINPYKLTRGTAEKPNLDLGSLSPDNPARQYPDLVVANAKTGELYLDPGEPMSRYLVLQGVQELIDQYDLAGIHYDDYFYPGTTFDDADTFAQYGAGYSDIADWRRHNVDLLVEQTYQLVHDSGKNMVFGVSPAGIWANKSTNPLGSNTSAGMQTYYDHYADTKKWIEQGWLDYIAPQIYWHIGSKQCDYATLVDWWSNITKNTNVKLYIGHAAYKVGDKNQGSAWMQPDEIQKQIQYNRANGNVHGSIFYGYSTLVNNTLGVQDTVMQMFQ